MADYKYTIGGGLVGALAGAALTKILEDEDKKATLGDYLKGSGIGLGLGAAGGLLVDSMEPESTGTKTTPNKPQAAWSKQNKPEESKEKTQDTGKKETSEKPGTISWLGLGSGLTLSVAGRRLKKSFNNILDRLYNSPEKVDTAVTRAEAVADAAEKHADRVNTAAQYREAAVAPARASIITNKKLFQEAHKARRTAREILGATYAKELARIDTAMHKGKPASEAWKATAADRLMTDFFSGPNSRLGKSDAVHKKHMLDALGELRKNKAAIDKANIKFTQAVAKSNAILATDKLKAQQLQASGLGLTTPSAQARLNKAMKPIRWAGRGAKAVQTAGDVLAILSALNLLFR